MKKLPKINQFDLSKDIQNNKQVFNELEENVIKKPKIPFSGSSTNFNMELALVGFSFSAFFIISFWHYSSRKSGKICFKTSL